MRTIKEADVRNIRVLVRTDLNVPIQNGRVLDNSKIINAIPTINFLRENGARIILMSDLGKTKGHYNPELKLNPVAEELERILRIHVKKIDDVIGRKAQKAVSDLNPGEILLLENLNFYPEDILNDDNFAQELAALTDIYVDDSFVSANRKNASNVGITRYKASYAGFLMEKEINDLSALLRNIVHPFVLIIGGDKPELKMPVIEKFISLADYILVGGVVGLTFLKALGNEAGLVKISDDAVDMAKDILSNFEKSPIIVPKDVIAVSNIEAKAKVNFVSGTSIPEDSYVTDIGPVTLYEFNKIIYDANLVLWHGSMGIHEIPDFANGTRSIVQAMASTDARTAAGGEDTSGIIRKYNKSANIDIISAGGRSFLEFLEGKELPALKVLTETAVV